MITAYSQDNGLRVLLEPINTSASISVGIWLKAGSRSEREDEYGYAHFVEHMLFKGTEGCSAKELARKIDRVGGQHNAATNREYTCYYISVMAEYLELAISVLADMYYNSLFEPQELEREKNVIIEEIRMYEDTPDEYIHDVFVEKMLSGHPLGHSILGSEKGIKSSTRESLTGFFKGHYLASNTIAAIAGNFDSDEASALIAKYFSRDCKPGSNSEGSESAFVIVPRQYHINRDLEQVHLCMGLPGLRRDDSDRWTMYVLSTILGGSMSSRLFQKIREEQALSYSIYSFHSSFSDAGIFGIYCATAPSKFEKAVSLILEECRQISENGISDEELADAKTFIRGNMALSFESNEVRMGQLAKSEMVFGRNYTFDEISAQIDAVDMDSFQKLSDKLFAGAQVSLITLGKLKDKDLKSLDLKIS